MSAPPFWATLRRQPWLVSFNLCLLLAGAAALSLRLWPEWRHNPDLSHGVFMPLVFLLLLRESRAARAPRFLPGGLAVNLAPLGVLLAALLTLGASGLYAAALGWTHALVNFTLTVSLVLFLTAGWIGFARDSVRLIPFNWSALVAIGLWLLSAPFPPGSYARLTLNLQFWVSENSVRVLHLLGIAAVRHGNIIELGRATVGVEEACSGVRSLLSCVFAGLFFSASLVRRPRHRALLVALAAPLALAMNFLRSLGLTLLANSGVDIAGTWHDATGFAVLGVTAVLLGGLALLFEQHEKKAAASSTSRGTPPATASVTAGQAARWPAATLAAGLALAAALVVVFVLNTRPSVRRDAPTPDLLALLPATAEGWTVDTSRDLYQFSDLLQTRFLAQRIYSQPATRTFIIIYVAYWRAGQAPVSLVASHTPDACWPGSGWEAQADPAARARLVVGPRPLAPAESRLFTLGDLPQHVWFWHLYDGRPIAYRDPYSPTELLRLAWRYGFRHDGDQLFVRVSSNRPWAEIAGEPLLAKFFAHTEPLGL
jgi:exosortase